MVKNFRLSTRFFYTALTVFSFVFSAKAQSSIDTALQNNGLTAKDSLKNQAEKPITVNNVTKTAEYPGGYSALIQFLSTRIQYPTDAIDKDIQGKVVLKFTVLKTGEIDPESIQIIKSVYPSLDSEAVRVIKLMPKWHPGYKDNVPVNTRFVLPVIFALQQ